MEKKYSFFLIFFLLQLNADELKIDLLLAVLQDSIHKLQENLHEVLKEPAQSELAGILQGVKLRKPSAPPAPKEESNPFGSLSSKIKQTASQSEESGWEAEDPLDKLDEEVKDLNARIGFLNWDTLEAAHNELYRLQGEIEKYKSPSALLKYGKRVLGIEQKIDNIEKEFLFLDKLETGVVNFSREGLSAQDKISFLLELTNGFDNIKKLGLTKIPGYIMSSLEGELNAFQATVKEKSFLDDIKKIRSAFGLSAYKPKKAEKPQISPQPIVPEKKPSANCCSAAK